MAIAEERVTALLHRAMNDPGPEGRNAFDMFVTKAKAKGGIVYFLTEEENDDPLMFVVNEGRRRIADLEQEVAILKAALDDVGAAPKKAKKFPWEKYPEIEQRAFEMRFYEKVPVNDIAAYIEDRAPEAIGNSTFLNQRFIQGRPSPSFGIEVKTGSEPTDWAELWKIGTREHADGWIQRVMRNSKAWEKFHQEGRVPKDWSKYDPNKLIGSREIKTLREMYHSNAILSAGKELESLIETAGREGITKADLKAKGVGGRRFDIEKQGVIFMIDGGKYVHYSFAHWFPDNAAAQIAALKYQAQHGAEIKVNSKSAVAA
jgi:hypothetical protein